MGGQGNRNLDRPDRQLTRVDKNVPSPLHETSYWIIRPVTGADLVQPIRDANVFTVRTGGQVGPPQDGMGRLNPSRIGRIASDAKLAKDIEI